MVREAAETVTEWLNTSKVALIFVFWLGVLTQQVWTLREHPDEAAHQKQLVKTIEMRTQINHANMLIAKLEDHVIELRAMAETKLLAIKGDIIKDVITRYADQRWRRGDMVGWVRRTERMNSEWRGASVFIEKNQTAE